MPFSKTSFRKPFPTASRSNGSHMLIGSFRPVFDKTPMETFLWISIAMPSPLSGDIYQLPRPRLSSTDLRKFASPLPTNMVWTKTNSSKALSNVVSLETEYGFRFIEAVCSLNFLSNTAYEELFAICKVCKHMHLPGIHFQALLHLLHHLCCHSHSL